MTIRISDESQLKQVSKRNQANEGAGGMSDWAIRQIQSELKSNNAKANEAAKKAGKAPKLVSGESPGEASLRLALRAAFGDWQNGGEVVQELIPFQDRAFRADFALPRYRITVHAQR